MSKHILIVDDSLSVRTQIKKALEGAGYQVTQAKDGVDGTSKLDSARFNLIVTDYNMPNMNGAEFVKVAMSHPQNKFTPVVMLTTEAGTNVQTEGKAAGVKVWLIKPFRPDSLLETVKRLIG